MRITRWFVVLVLLLAGLAACTPTPAPTAAPAPTPTPAAVQSPTAAPTAAPSPSIPTAPAPTLTPSVQSPTVAPTTVPTVAPSATPAMVQVTVYFTDRNRFNTGTLPFEVGVSRTVTATANLPEAALDAFFQGPTAAEQAQGLEKIASGFTGYSALTVQDGIARVYLSGPCASNGATYTIAQPVIKTLRQFPEIKAVKIYDAEGNTGEPDGATNSIPACLEP